MTNMQFLDGSHVGNNLSQNRMRLLLFELDCNFDCLSKVNEMKRGNGV
jgi:hypothetical protein